MIAIIYVFLLLLMLLALFVSSRNISLNRNPFSFGGIIGIIAYTLNEGLRFGRDMDYNYYGNGYERLLFGYESNQDIGYRLFENVMASIGLPWQICVMIMSLIFIVCLFFLMRAYKEVIIYALPLYVLVSLHNVENNIRWYFAFSIFMIGLFYQVTYLEKIHHKYVIYSCIACMFHYAFFPIPIAFYIISRFKKPLFNPYITIALFFLIGLLFKTDYMMQFVDIANLFIGLSDKFEGYGNNIDYWLTSGSGGITKPAFPGLLFILFNCVLVYCGAIILKNSKRMYVFAYNLYIVGFIIFPIGNQIELVLRYVFLFFHFMAIVSVYVLLNRCRINRLLYLSFFLLLFVFIIKPNIYNPFFDNPKKYLYIWSAENETYDSMIEMWKDDDEKRLSK